jgi:DNA-binding winged helix-turn-helix (wHTH) protein
MKCWTFGDFVLDLNTHELVRAGTPVSLSPKAFHLLAILVENHPKALSRTELQDRLWPGTFVVEKNLTNLVSEIREALGDDPVHPRFIRTVHRFGYAFREVPATDRGGDVSAYAVGARRLPRTLAVTTSPCRSRTSSGAIRKLPSSCDSWHRLAC